MDLRDIIRIEKGKRTDPLNRSAKSVSESLCFSIITTYRSLDLQAPTEALRDRWVLSLHLAVRNRNRHEDKAAEDKAGEDKAGEDMP